MNNKVKKKLHFYLIRVNTICFISSAEKLFVEIHVFKETVNISCSSFKSNNFNLNFTHFNLPKKLLKSVQHLVVAVFLTISKLK